MEEKYLKDAVDVNDIQYGKLNVITAPCGCGKTTFVEQKLWQESWWGDLLLLIDSKSGLQAFKLRGEPHEYNGEVYYKHDGITAMTYATFAALCIYKPQEWLWLDENALIVCDELHQCIKWSKIEQENNSMNLHKVAIQEIHKRIDIGARVVALSATPRVIYQEYKDAVNMPIHAPLKHYKIGTTNTYSNIWNLIKTLPADKKGVIYVPHVSQMIDVSNALAERDIESVCIWSMNNSNKMDKEQLDAIECVTKYEKMPNNVQVLIINAAYETGLNIKSQVDYVVVNDSNEDTQIQVIGRVRHDIDTVYLLDKANNIVWISGKQMEGWLDKPLTVEDKDRLCTELGFKDKWNRPLGWTSIKKSLKFSFFKVTEKRTKKERYTIVSIG